VRKESQRSEKRSMNKRKREEKKERIYNKIEEGKKEKNVNAEVSFEITPVEKGEREREREPENVPRVSKMFHLLAFGSGRFSHREKVGSRWLQSSRQ